MSAAICAFGIADRQVAAAQGRALARLDARGADAGGRLVAGDLRQFQAFELLALRLRQRGGAGAGLVLGDELFQVPPLGEDRLRSSVPRARAARAGYSRKASTLPGNIVSLPRDRSSVWLQVAPRNARSCETIRHAASIVSQEVLQQDLRAQVEEVRRLVEQQQVRLVQQQGRQLDARLPAAGELGDRARRGRRPSARTARRLRRTSSRAGRCRASGSRARSRRAGTDRAGADSPAAAWDGG